MRIIGALERSFMYLCFSVNNYTFFRDIANTFCARPITKRREPESAMDESELVPLKPMGKWPFTCL